MGIKTANGKYLINLAGNRIGYKVAKAKTAKQKGTPPS